MAKKKIKEGIYCAKCDIEMKEVLLPSYEYEQGLPLHNVSGYKCHKCGKIFFTELQAKEMKARSEELKEYTFGLKEKLLLVVKVWQ